jgi:hypothetical protein
MKWERDYEDERRVQAIVEFAEGPWRGEPPKAYRTANAVPALNALVSRDEIEEGDLRWHVSVTAPNRVPTWAEMVEAAHDLRPGVYFVVGVPPRSAWMNYHPHCLHLYETKDGPLERQWRAEGRGHQPTP